MGDFDIGKHKWGDGDITNVFDDLCGRVVIQSGYKDYVIINKDDAIAIAKHFKLMEEYDE